MCVFIYSSSCRAHFYIHGIYLLNCFLFTWYLLLGSKVLHISSFHSIISHVQWSWILLKCKYFKLTKCYSSRFSHRSSYSLPLLITLRTLQTTPYLRGKSWRFWRISKSHCSKTMSKTSQKKKSKASLAKF